MQPKIIDLPPKNLIGHFREMSLTDDHTQPLFRQFMPQRKVISGRVDNQVYDLRVYDAGLDFSTFGPNTRFTKWAAVEVGSTSVEQEGFHLYHLTGGLYARFDHRGAAADAANVFGFIFRNWMPLSVYELDDRPHFETMPERYNPSAVNAEEQIWIPIKISQDIISGK